MAEFTRRVQCNFCASRFVAIFELEKETLTFASSTTCPVCKKIDFTFRMTIENVWYGVHGVNE